MVGKSRKTFFSFLFLRVQASVFHRKWYWCKKREKEIWILCPNLTVSVAGSMEFADNNNFTLNMLIPAYFKFSKNHFYDHLLWRASAGRNNKCEKRSWALGIMGTQSRNSAWFPEAKIAEGRKSQGNMCYLLNKFLNIWCRANQLSVQVFMKLPSFLQISFTKS